jgi:HEAT repeat protein
MSRRSASHNTEADFEASKEAIEAALALEHQPGEERLAEQALRPALRALERSPHPAALMVLRRAYDRSLSPWGQSWAAHAIASLPDERRWVFLRNELEAPVWRVRMICVQALRKQPDTTPLLLRALLDPQWRVRDAAARALGRANATDALLGALEAALNDEDQRVIAAAERSLDRLRRGGD